jgi:hypothetical protein
MCTGKFIREFWPRAHAQHWGRQQNTTAGAKEKLYSLVEFLHSSAPPRRVFYLRAEISVHLQEATGSKVKAAPPPQMVLIFENA